ncbi:hypothetical protein BC936DRAFT_141270 [Jimgerdemannia flammicorona]|uniref:Phosphodiesterase n=1 Tax=Jimgerdemannia flammicorona TaxID=994334 RepID=A0A433A2M4_9FUNG|nr:hypothetical protein BC936DRAFT_141270 [Jimgerdemannia flammicorona]
MDPSRCSVIVVDSTTTSSSSQTSPLPYSLSPDNVTTPDNTVDSTDALVPLLETVFAKVLLESSGDSVLNMLRSRTRWGHLPTILLIDLDNKPRETLHDSSTENNDTDTLGEDLWGMELLKAAVRDVEEGRIHDVVPIVFSKNDSPKVMMQCLNMGAADYLIKPIRLEVVKTLFLNMYRHHPFRNKVYIPDRVMETTESQATRRERMWNTLHDRMYDMFVKDKWVSDLIVEYYSPHDLSISLQGFPSLDEAANTERTKFLKARISSWDFLPHEFAEEDLMRCVYLIFQQVLAMEELRDLGVSKDQLHRFIYALRNSYHNSNPYHNFAHAVDVLQATYFFLCKMGLLQPMHRGNRSSFASKPSQPARFKNGFRVQELLRPKDIFALIVASIGHDVGHPGVNNVFLINTGTPLALLYNDRSVLESFHAMSLFHMMKKHGFDFCNIENASNPGYMGMLISFRTSSQRTSLLSCTYSKPIQCHSSNCADFRKLVVNTILATDMGLHFEYVSKIKEQYNRLKLQGLNMNGPSTIEQERLLVCGAIIKCADISNCVSCFSIVSFWKELSAILKAHEAYVFIRDFQARPFHEAEKWSEILLEEFGNQGDLERDMGMPVIPTNDRGKLSQAESQIGFIKNVALPLFESVKEVIPGMWNSDFRWDAGGCEHEPDHHVVFKSLEMSFCVDYMQENVRHWEARKAGQADRSHRPSETPTLVNPLVYVTTENDRDQPYRQQAAAAHVAFHPNSRSNKSPATSLPSIANGKYGSENDTEDFLLKIPFGGDGPPSMVSDDYSSRSMRSKSSSRSIVAMLGKSNGQRQHEGVDGYDPNCRCTIM